jgi:hypothetical protein
VTRGGYLGHRRSYLSLQIDDVLLGNHGWDPAADAVDRNPGAMIRMTPEDATHAADWARARGLRLDLVSNGAGSERYAREAGLDVDPLLRALLARRDEFGWINHTLRAPQPRRGLPRHDRGGHRPQSPLGAPGGDHAGTGGPGHRRAHPAWPIWRWRRREARIRSSPRRWPRRESAFSAAMPPGPIRPTGRIPSVRACRPALLCRRSGACSAAISDGARLRDGHASAGA